MHPAGGSVALPDKEGRERERGLSAVRTDSAVSTEKVAVCELGENARQPPSRPHLGLGRPGTVGERRPRVQPPRLRAELQQPELRPRCVFLAREQELREVGKGPDASATMSRAGRTRTPPPKCGRRSPPASF